MAPLPANAIGEDGEPEVAKNLEPNLRICQLGQYATGLPKDPFVR